MWGGTPGGTMAVGILGPPPPAICCWDSGMLGGMFCHPVEALVSRPGGDICEGGIPNAIISAASLSTPLRLFMSFPRL